MPYKAGKNLIFIGSHVCNPHVTRPLIIDEVSNMTFILWLDILWYDQTISSIAFAGYDSSSISQLKRELAKQILK